MNCPHCGGSTDPWDTAAQAVAEFVAEMARMEKAVTELESSVLCMKLALSVIEAKNGRVHESAN